MFWINNIVESPSFVETSNLLSEFAKRIECIAIFQPYPKMHSSKPMKTAEILQSTPIFS